MVNENELLAAKYDSKNRRIWSDFNYGRIVGLFQSGLDYKEIGHFLDASSSSIEHKLRDKKFNWKRLIHPKKDIDIVLKENEKLKQYIGILNELKKAEPFVIEPSTSKTISESAAVMQLSDWHIEEEVDPNTVNSINKFNLDIAKHRIEHTFKRGLKLIQLKEKDTKIKTIIVILGGDFITGNIHEENLENCQLQPIKAILLAMQYLCSGIDFLLNNTNFRLVFVSVMGNHSRITEKIRHSTEAGNSLEYLMYKAIENKYSSVSRCKFLITEGYFNYLSIFSKIYRISHGHAVKFQGGVGGFLVPLRRAIGQWNKARYADVDILHHFHSENLTKRIIVNGSLIGYNAYALSKAMEFEEPQQNIFLINKTKGVTEFMPVYYEK